MGSIARPARALRLSLLASALLAGAAPAAPAGDPDPDAPTARVTYVTSSTVYLDAGRRAGLEDGATVLILRDGEEIAVLEVEAASTDRAACRRPPDGPEIRVGDEASWTAAPAPADSAGEPEGPRATRPAPVRARSARSWLRERGLRGRAGVRYTRFDDGSGFGQDWSQPALDLRVDGRRVFDRPLDVEIDLRARRTWRTRADGTDDVNGRTRVYRLAAAWSPATGRGGWRIAGGRQLSGAVTSISVFDGVSAAWTAEAWEVGAFSGAQPDPETWGFSSDILEHGAWLTRRGRPATRTRWLLTAGAVGSYRKGEVDREFLVLQGRWLSPRWVLSAIQEVDANRGWKADVESAVTATSTYASARWRTTGRLDLDAGYDGRRRVRTWRDRTTPETDFDDSLRRGAWTGARWRVTQRTRVGLSWRRSWGGPGGVAHSTTATARARFPRRSDLAIAGRATRYVNERTEGWLTSASAGVAVGGRARIEIEGGRRFENGDSIAAGSDQSWIGLDGDVRLGGAWYLIAHGERSFGDLEEGTQLYTSAVYRF